MRKLLIIGLVLALIPQQIHAARIVAVRETAANCGGEERWAIKTLTDQSEELVHANFATSTTVQWMREQPVPAGWSRNEDGERFQPIETEAWSIDAIVLGAKLEADADYHLVIADPGKPAATMIAEIPNPECKVAFGSRFGGEFSAARLAFEQCFGRMGPRLKRFGKGVAVRLTGVGFFDALHGQDGVAPNGIELHPVLSLVPKGACPVHST